MREVLRHALDEIAALDLHAQRFVERVGRPDLDLDLLGGPLAEEEVVLLLEVVNDRLIHLVAGDPHRARVHDTGERDHRHIRGAAADVDDHVARGFGDRQTGADGSGRRLFDEIDLARPGLESGVLDRAFFDLGDLGRHRNDDPRPHEERAAVRLADEVLEHLLGDLEVGDHAVLHRSNGLDVARCLAQHLLGLGADRFDPVGDPVDGDDRRLDDC